MTHETTNNLLRLIPLALVAIALTALLVATGAFNNATAAQPLAPEIAHARISVPPSAPPELVAADGFDGLANPYTGVYHLSLAPGLQLTATSTVLCAGTKPGVTCAVDFAVPPAGDPYVVVYRDWYGSPQDGDVRVRLEIW